MTSQVLFPKRKRNEEHSCKNFQEWSSIPVPSVFFLLAESAQDGLTYYSVAVLDFSWLSLSCLLVQVILLTFCVTNSLQVNKYVSWEVKERKLRYEIWGFSYVINCLERLKRAAWNVGPKAFERAARCCVQLVTNSLCSEMQLRCFP